MPGPRVAISQFLPSNDGTRVAVVLAPGGSENGVLRIVDVKTGAMLPDTADRADFGSVAWSDDGNTVYYLRRQELKPGDPPVAKYLNVRTYAHVVGQPSASDVPVFGAGIDPAVAVPPTVFAVFAVSPETPYASGLLINGVDRFATVYVAPKSAIGNPATIPWRQVISRDDLVTNAAVHGDTIYALTAKNAPRFRLVSFTIGQTFAQAVDVIPAGSRVIDNVATASDGSLRAVARERARAHHADRLRRNAQRDPAPGERHDRRSRDRVRPPGIHRPARELDRVTALVRVTIRPRTRSPTRGSIRLRRSTTRPSSPMRCAFPRATAR